MFSPLLHRLQDICLHATTPVSRRCVRMTPATLMEALPALGGVLYMPMLPHASSTWIVPHGVLLEAMQLAPLLQVQALVAASMIGVDGPREWVECLDRAGRTCARLYLLPDTDYLVWDALLASGASMPDPSRRFCHSRPASAQLLRFHRRRLAGLDVLGAETVTRASPLSNQLAGHIARAEALLWQPQTDS
jgi:hypothetical protein